MTLEITGLLSNVTLEGTGMILSRVLILAMLVAPLALTTPLEAGQRGLGIQTTKRTLLLKPDYEAGLLEGSSVLTILNSSQEPISRIPLIMYYMLQITSAHTSDDETLKFTQHIVPMKGHEKMRVNYVDIVLNKPMSPGTTLTLGTQYGGKLAGYVEVGQSYVKDHIKKDFTIIRPDCLAYPIVSAPSIEDVVRSAQQDFRKGWDYSLEVTVPEDLVVANGGKLLGKVSQNGMVTYRYRNIKPAWRIDICIARYGVLQDEDTSLRVLYLPDHEEEARTVLSASLKAMQSFSKSFGPLPEFEGFAVIEVPDGYGSQTDVTCILQEAEAFKGNLHTLYHEVSHLWNPPELDEHNSRFLTEGLGRFLEYLLEENLDNKTGSLQVGLARSREKFRRQCRQDPKYRDTPIVDYGKYDCTDASYTKGMIAFWILYRLVGEQAFLDIYRSFHVEYRKGGATLEDFTRHVKKSSERDLSRFFDEWIYGIKSSDYLLDKEMSLESIFHLYELEQDSSAGG